MAEVHPILWHEAQKVAPGGVDDVQGTIAGCERRHGQIRFILPSVPAEFD